MTKREYPKTPMGGFRGKSLAFRQGYTEAFHWERNDRVEDLQAEDSARCDECLEGLNIREKQRLEGARKAVQDLIILRGFEALSADQKRTRFSQLRNLRVHSDERRIVLWYCGRNGDNCQ